jgi:EmrB/QacA subfamily drug resistance transporter
LTHPRTLPELRERYGATRYRWLLLFAVMVGAVAAIMSSTIINVAVPGMSHHFHLGQDQAQWVSSGFMVAMTVSMLTTPWLLGRFGYRRTYAGTMWLLMAGGILGGFANTYELVLTARVAEGLAAGVVQPIPAIIVMRAFEPHEQGRAMGIFSLGAVLAPAMGPAIGGLLVDAFGWRSIFFIVVPFCAAALVLSARLVPDTPPAGMGGAQKLDAWSMALATGATLCMLNGLVQLRHAVSVQSLGLLLAGGAGLAGFAWRQRHLARRRAEGGGTPPLMDPALFRDRRFAMGSLVALTYGMALFGSTYLIPVHMQLALQMSASHVGTVLLPAGLALAITIALVGRLTDRVPTHLLVSTGLVLLATSFVLNFLLGLQTPVWAVGGIAVLGRIGFGCVLPSLNLGAMRSLHRDLIPQASSAINFIRTLGGATGVSLCGIVLEWRLQAHGDSLANAASSTARLAAFNEAFLMLALLCGLALLAAWQLRDPQAVEAPSR